MSLNLPRDFSLTFGAAGTQEVKATGRHIRVMSNTVAGGSVWIAPEGGSELERFAGQGINVSAADDPQGKFSRFTVRVAVACTVRVCVSDQRQDDDQESVSVSVSATVTPGNTLTSTTDVSILAASSGQVVPARADRLAVQITNLLANASEFRIGESPGVGAARGEPLQPGETITLATTSAVHAYNADGSSAQSLAVLEVRDV